MNKEEKEFWSVIDELEFEGDMTSLTIKDESLLFNTAKAHFGSPWIPVGERFPEDFALVLIWEFDCELHSIMIRYDKNWYVPATDSPYKGKITHWQDLPEPPKGE